MTEVNVEFPDADVIDETLGDLLEETEISDGELSLAALDASVPIVDADTQLTAPRFRDIIPPEDLKAVSNGFELSATDSVGAYLDSIGKVPLLTKEQEVGLAQIIEVGTEAQRRMEAGERSRTLRSAVREAEHAREHFIRSNLRLVVSIAKKYPVPHDLDLLDLIQEGNLGLEHAVRKFDWRQGFKFSTYATFWIRQAVGRALDSKSGLVRLPGDKGTRLRTELRAVDNEVSELSPEMQRHHALRTPTSIHRDIGGDGTSELGDLLADEDTDTALEAERVLVADHLRQTYTSFFNEQEVAIIELRIGIRNGEPLSYREIGEVMGMTTEKARRVYMNCVKSLRKWHEENLHDYF